MEKEIQDKSEAWSKSFYDTLRTVFGLPKLDEEQEYLLKLFAQISYTAGYCDADKKTYDIRKICGTCFYTDNIRGIVALHCDCKKEEAKDTWWDDSGKVRPYNTCSWWRKQRWNANIAKKK